MVVRVGKFIEPTGPSTIENEYLVASNPSVQPAVHLLPPIKQPKPIFVAKPVAHLFKNTIGYGNLDNDQLQSVVDNMSSAIRHQAALEQELHRAALAKMQEQLQNLVKQLEELKAPALPDPHRKQQYTRKIVAVLDKHNISLVQYHEMNMARLPHETKECTLYALRQERKLLNEFAQRSVPINKLNGDAEGGWISPTKMLLADIRKYPLPEGEAKTKIRLNIGGDGRVADRHHDQTILTMSVMNERKIKTLHKIAVVRGGESYEMIRDAMYDLRAELKELQAHGLRDPESGREFDVELWMCTDWKFLRIVRGMNHCGGNVKFFCIWCNRTKTERETSIHRIRPVQDERAHGAVGEEGRVAPDLFAFIPLSRTVPDLLHMFLRVTDILLEEFLKDVWNYHMSSNSDKEKVEECCAGVMSAMKAAKVSFKF